MSDTTELTLTITGDDERGYDDDKLETMTRRQLTTALRHSRRRQEAQGVRIAELRARAEAAEALLALRGVDGPSTDAVSAVKSAQAALTAHNARRPDRKLRSDFDRWQAKRERLIEAHDRAVAVYREGKHATKETAS